MRKAEGFAVGAMVAAVAITIGWHLLPADFFDNPEKQVSASAQLSAGCRVEHPGYPVELRIHNGSKRTVKSLRMHVAVYERGQSEDLSKWPQDDVTFIVPPQETLTLCHALQMRYGRQVPSDPAIVGRLEGVTFFRDDETIPR